MFTSNLFTTSLEAAFTSIQAVLILAVLCWMLIVSVGAVTLFVFLRLQVRQLSSQTARQEWAASKLAAEFEAQALQLKQTFAELEELRKRLLNYEERTQPAASIWPSSGLPMNLNRRGQILRLSRKGKSVAEIASDLHVAQGEVELLLKVHDLSQKNPTLQK
jgi:uncharacterized membrane-anchored protein YhcB (DUF1043 family)